MAVPFCISTSNVWEFLLLHILTSIWFYHCSVFLAILIVVQQYHIDLISVTLVQETKEMYFRSLVWEGPLEEEMATHFCILAWKIPWTEELEGLVDHGVTKSWTWLSNWVCMHTHVIDHMYFFLNIEPTLHTWDKSQMLVVYNFFIYCWIWFADILLQIFPPMFMRDVVL